MQAAGGAPGAGAGEPEDELYLEETFYILSKKKAVFVVRLTARGLALRRELPGGGAREQLVPLGECVGARCMRLRSAARRPACACAGAPGAAREEEPAEGDVSAYLHVYAYARRARARGRRRAALTLRFRSYDRYEDNHREAQKWRATLKWLLAGRPPPAPLAAPAPAVEARLLVLLNPKSGAGKARENFQQKVAPILAEAEVPYDLHVTKCAQYAREFVRTRNVYSWRGIVAVGGDGILFEVLNGLFERLDWQQALAEVPLAILPSGSGNGLARSICHYYEPSTNYQLPSCHDQLMFHSSEPYVPGQLIGPAMIIARGKTAPMDVTRIETRTQIMYSFLSVGWGFLSDVDIESERLRAIGGQRFTVWALARLMGLRTYKGVVSYVPIANVNAIATVKQPLKLSHSISQDGALDSPDTEGFADCDENDVFANALNGVQRRQRVDSWYSVNSRRSAFFSTRGSEYHSVSGSEADIRSPVAARMYGPASYLPSLLAALPSHWVHEEGEFVMVHMSSQGYIGEDFFFAPRSRLSDGILWMIMIKAGISRGQLLSFLLGVGNGSHVDVNSEFIKVVPVSAFRIVPEGTSGYLTVDGELVEYGPIQGEVFPNLVNVMVPSN